MGATKSALNTLAYTNHMEFYNKINALHADNLLRRVYATPARQPASQWQIRYEKLIIISAFRRAHVGVGVGAAGN